MEKSATLGILFHRLAAQRASVARSPADVDGEEEAWLTQAYATNLSHRLPLIYSVVVFNVSILIFAFLGTSPDWLTLYLPIPLIFLCVYRAVH